jgi:hypothetical protein
LTGSIGHPRDIEEAKDAIELLQVQLEGKKAELLESRALVEQVHRQFSRQQKLRERGAVGEEEVDQLRTELTVREARLKVKQAQIKEVEVRLSQAKRWLSRLQSGSQRPVGKESNFSSGGVSSGSSSLSGRGQVGSTSSAAGSRTTPAKTSAIGSDSSGQYPQTIPTAEKSEASGAKSTYTAGGAGSGVGNKIEEADAPGATEQRIRNLEKKLDRLMEQVEALRRELRRQQPAGRAEAGKPVDPSIRGRQ